MVYSRRSVATRSTARIAAALSVGALWLLSSSAVRADERTEARTHFKKGMSAIAEGHYDAGLEELKQAYDILPHPNVLYNIARAYVDTGDLENAVIYYKRYLEGGPKDRDEVAGFVAGLEARIRKQQASLVEAETQAPTGPAAAPGGKVGPGAGTSPVPTPGPGGGAGGVEPGSSASGAGGQLKTEEVFEETVVTASKSAQSPLDAPNSTSIITAQDIRLSGITKLPELLRRLAGVDIMEVTGAQSEVSLRGFNQRLSNKVLVLLDGRSVYTDLIGATLWSSIPIAVEDIDRIEVVRGPGSALYGADAFNGVVNIITKPPGEGGSGFNAGYGERNAAHGDIWSNGRNRDLSYRIAAGYDYLPRWTREVPPGRVDLNLFEGDQDASARGYRLDGDIRQQLGKDTTVGIAGGYQEGMFEILGVGPINDQIIQGDTLDTAAFLNARNGEVRVFWNHADGQNSNNAATIGQSFLPARFVTNVVDAEAQYIARFETGAQIDHELHLGAEYRLKDITWSYQAQDQTEHHVGLFLHDEVKIRRKFAVVADYRADYVPYLQRIVQSPRGSVLFHPSDKSTVRGIVATAFRTPTFLESYIGYQIQLPAAGASLTTLHPGQIEPEQIFTTELGYMNQESDFFTVDSAVFYNHANNLIQVAPNERLTVADLGSAGNPLGLNAQTGLYPIFDGGFANQCQDYNVYGAELGVRTFPVEGLDVYGNYTLMDVVQNNDGCTAEQKALLVNDARTSAHKLNLGVQARSRFGLDGEVDFHYVSPQDWAEQVSDIQKQQVVYQSFHLDAYTLVNARLGYRFLRNRAEVSGVAFNLFDYRHREHPFGQIVGRQLMAFFSYKF